MDRGSPSRPDWSRALGMGRRESPSGSRFGISTVMPETPLSGQQQYHPSWGRGHGVGCSPSRGHLDLSCFPLIPLWSPPPEASNLEAVLSGAAPRRPSFLPGLEDFPLCVMLETSQLRQEESPPPPGPVCPSLQTRGECGPSIPATQALRPLRKEGGETICSAG